MKRNSLFASLAVSLFIVAATAQSNAYATSSAAGTIVEDAHPAGGRGTLEHPLATESVFPSQGPAD